MGKEKREPIERIRGNSDGGGRLALIIGLIAGIIAVVTALVFVVVLVILPGRNAQREKLAVPGEQEIGMSETLSSTENLPEGSALAETLGSIQETETEIFQSEAGTARNEAEKSRIAAIAGQMTVEQKIDQLFILTPITMVNSYLYEENQSVDIVKRVGDTTRKAYEFIAPGGLLISKNNIDDDNGTILPFITSAETLESQKGSLKPFIAVTDDVIECLSQGGVNDYTPDIMYQDSAAVSISKNLQIEVIKAEPIQSAEPTENTPSTEESESEAFEVTGTGAKYTGQSIYKMLENGFNMFLIESENFDYLSLRSELAAYIRQNGVSAEKLLDEKLAAVLMQKLDIETETRQQIDKTQAEQSTDGYGDLKRTNGYDGVQSTGGYDGASGTGMDGRQQDMNDTDSQNLQTMNKNNVVFD